MGGRKCRLPVKSGNPCRLLIGFKHRSRKTTGFSQLASRSFLPSGAANGSFFRERVDYARCCLVQKRETACIYGRFYRVCRLGIAIAKQNFAMNNAFQFHSHLAFGGEILSQTATFLPGDAAETTNSMGIFMSELKHLPVFRRFSRFVVENNSVAQPMLYGGCNEMR
jgi:hypothetical protein